MKEIQVNNLIAPKNLNLKNVESSIDFGVDNKRLKKELKTKRKALAKWQDKLYAHGKYSILVCIQGMDTAGKDSLIREVFQGFNSRGVVVHSFKTPSKNELRHDYLWRHYKALPERGKFGVFNRTHYENVLVTRVHPEFILNENLPNITSVKDITPDFWQERFQQINAFEKNINQNGTLIFKFFLHLSKDEQKHRLLRRLYKPEKNWKFSPGDIEERKLWDEYQYCYQEAIKNTNTKEAPWYIIPADNKKAARYLVAKVLWEKLHTMQEVQEPVLAPDVLENLEIYIKNLEKEAQ